MGQKLRKGSCEAPSAPPLVYSQWALQPAQRSPREPARPADLIPFAGLREPAKRLTTKTSGRRQQEPKAPEDQSSTAHSTCEVRCRFEHRRLRHQAAPRLLPIVCSANLIASHPLQDRAHRNTAGAFRNIGLRILNPGDPSNVEMDPWRVFGKVMQKLGRDDCSTPPAARVFDVTDIRLDQFGIFLAEWQPPEPLSGDLKRRLELGVDSVVV